MFGPDPSIRPCAGIGAYSDPGGVKQDGDGGMRPGCGFCPFSGVDGYCIRACRGRPMCRPVGGFREETCPGGHTGPPLRGVGSVQRSTEIGMKRRLVQRGGAEPAPYRGSGAGGCVQDGGVWSPRPTEATQVVPSGGPMWASAPTRDEGCGGVWSPRPTGASQVVRSERADVPKAWLPPTKFRVEIWGVGQVVVPYGGVFPWGLHFVENFFRERGGSPLDGEGKRCYLESLQARMGLAARSRGRKCPPVCPVSGKRVWMRPNSGGTTDRFDSP